MRYCHNCHRLTGSQAPFCNFCGRSYDTKFCPRLHPNPRAAKACSQCGSHDLSMPQPKIPMWLRPFVLLLSIGPGYLLLGGILVYLGLHFYRFFTSPCGIFLSCAFLGLALYLWLLLPKFIRRGITRLLGGAGKAPAHKEP